MTDVPRRPASGPNPWLATPVLVAMSGLAAVLPSGREVFGTDTLWLVLALDVVLLLLLVLGFVRKPPHLWLWLLGLGLVPFGAAISGVNSSVTASSIVGASLAIMCLLFPCVLARLQRDRPGSMRTVVRWFLIGQSISALAGLAQLAGLELATGLIFGRATGFAGHPNTLGFMAALAIISVIASWGPGGPATRWSLSGVLILNAVVLVATGSLSAMLAAVVAIAFGVVASRKVIGTAVSFVLVGAAGLTVSQLLLPEGNSLLDSIGYRLNVVTGDSDGAGGAASLDVRGQTYDWAWRWIDQSPVIGVGMDPQNAGTFDGTTVVHNFLLRGWYQGGVPVFVWLTLIALTVAVLVTRSIFLGQGTWATAAAASVIVFAFTSAFLNQPTYWLPLLFAMTIAAMQQRKARDAQSVGGLAGEKRSLKPVGGLSASRQG